MPTLVMTGGTRGLGRAVVDRVLALPDWRIVLLARGAKSLAGLAPAIASRVDVVAADLADLRSVQGRSQQLGGRRHRSARPQRRPTVLAQRPRLGRRLRASFRGQPPGACTHRRSVGTAHGARRADRTYDQRI